MRPGLVRFITVPARLRALVRGGEIGLVGLAGLVGCGAGVAVAAMGVAAQGLRELLYQIAPGTRLSAATDLEPVLVVIGPAIGGALLGLLLFVLSRPERPRRAMIDPIEANALHGGRMSVRDSGLVAVQNVVSNGSGASVGLEAGYTQLCAGFASRLGIAFELRRSDLRTLVGCGSAAAIAAAFEAPLTGAFYAFELIIGTYSIAILTPVVVSALCGSLVAKALVAQPALVAGVQPGSFVTGAITAIDTLPSLMLGLICAALGVGIMRAVTLVESGIRASRVPAAVAPMLGGFCVGGLALAVSPQILSGGHGALHLQFEADGPAIGALALAVLFLAKAAASAISIGCGFRGGLFFASLFLGGLAGKCFAALMPEVLPGLVAFGLTPLAYGVVGMSALAVAVVGGPLTMTFLALELTGSFPITGLVLVAVIASSLTVRKTFGYSFATWRFHLRGESIRSAHDVGWIRSLTVAALMRRDATTVDLTTSLPAFLAEHPLGSSSRVIVVDDADRYAGIVLVPEAHEAARQAAARADDPPRLTDLVRYPDAFLLPEMNAKAAAAAFDRSESEALAVLESRDTRRVIGLLTESHTLKRYSEELDRQRQAMVGEAV
ncbi:chloride channel protein [uncultured Methylobacterium sp.]|uniref:chloride channel protein n=1 Tax=uncultured Methylobacterium sp. TaxID=157278 RepID=UPI0035C95DD2